MYGYPWTKFVVPSMGSTTKVGLGVRWDFPGTYVSSPRNLHRVWDQSSVTMGPGEEWVAYSLVIGICGFERGGNHVLDCLVGFGDEVGGWERLLVG